MTISSSRQMDQRYWTQRWINALRTTTASQIYGRATDTENGRCAIGVLRDVLVEDGLVPSLHAEWNENHSEVYRASALQSLRYLAVRLNDRERLSFPEIADQLQACLPPRDSVLITEEADVRELVTV